MPDLFAAPAGPIVLSSSERVDRSFARVEPCSGPQEIEVEHHQKGIEEGIQNSTRLAATPDGWKSENADQVIHAALQPFYFGRGIRLFWSILTRRYWGFIRPDRRPRNSLRNSSGGVKNGFC